MGVTKQVDKPMSCFFGAVIDLLRCARERYFSHLFRCESGFSPKMKQEHNFNGTWGIKRIKFKKYLQIFHQFQITLVLDALTLKLTAQY